MVSEFIIECLKKFNYPNIHGIDEYEILNIFSNQNRMFLIRWIFKQINEEYAMIVDDPNITKEDLAELVCENGFCMTSEQNSFINGEMSPEAQLAIFHRMFKFLSDVAGYKDIPKSTSSLSLAEINDLFKKDVNLFPSLGEKQTLTTEERQAKLEEYKNKIRDLEELVSGERNENNVEGEDMLDKLNRDLDNLIEKLTSHIKFDFNKAFYEIRKTKKGKKITLVDFDETVLNAIKESNLETATMAKFLECFNQIVDLEYSMKLKKNGAVSVSSMREVALLASEINNSHK